MATLKDISRHLNLSVTTVSRALNGFPEVNEETRQLVKRTAIAMNYRPNQFARKLVTGRSGHGVHDYSGLTRPVCQYSFYGSGDRFIAVFFRT